MTLIAQFRANYYLWAGQRNRAIKKLFKQARSSRKRGHFREALGLLEQIGSLEPRHAEARHLAADILIHLGDWNRAASITESLLVDNPIDIRSIRRLRRLSMPFCTDRDAATEYLKAMSNSPNTCVAVARYFNETSAFQDAAATAATGLALNTLTEDQRAALLSEQAISFAARSRFEEAAGIFAQMPFDTARYHAVFSEHVRCLLELGRFDDAEAVLRRKGRLDERYPVFDRMVQLLLFMKGDVQQAHRLFLYRETSRRVQRYLGRRLWRIVPLEIRTRDNRKRSAVVLAEWGPGDEIRYATSYGDLAKLFDAVTITCDPRLKALLNRSFPNIQFLPVTRYRYERPGRDLSDRKRVKDGMLLNFVSDRAAVAAKRADVVFTVLDALAEIRCCSNDFINPSRLRPEPMRSARWRAEIDMRSAGRKNVGIAWRSILQSAQRDTNYVNVTDLAVLVELDHVNWWILQPGITKFEHEQLESMQLSTVFCNIDLVDDFEEQAALLSQLDAFVGPFTTMVELASIVGTRTLVLAPTRLALWRRKANGSDMWHPNCRILFGTPIWDRSSLMRAVVRELRE